jgi:hypothetical protein
VSGTLGGAALALREQRAGGDSAPGRAAQRRLDWPEPRVTLGLRLAELAKDQFVHAAIDLSDGLAGDLGHILERSAGRLGATLWGGALPLDPALQGLPWGDSLELALRGGDDYELAFTAPARARATIAALSIAGVAALMLYSLATRQTLHLSVIRDRNPAFVMLSDGSVRNGYALKIVNMEPRAREVEIAVEDAPDAVITIPGAHLADGAVHLNLAPDAVTETHIFVALQAAALDEERTEIAFRLTDKASGQTDRHETAFLSGGRHERDDER